MKQKNTSGTLYPLADGTHTFTNGSVSVTNGNHIEISRTVGGTTNSYAELYPLDANGTSIMDSANRKRVSDKWFSIKAGDEWVLELKNFRSSNTGQKMTINFLGTTYNKTAYVMSTEQFTRSNTDKSFSGTFQSDDDIGSLSTWFASFASTISFDIEFYVNGSRYF